MASKVRVLLPPPAFARCAELRLGKPGSSIVAKLAKAASPKPAGRRRADCRKPRELRLGKPGSSIVAKLAKAASPKPAGRRRADCRKLRELRLGKPGSS